MTVCIALATTSGSSGKTTTACSLAAVLAERGQHVLVVDCDWQMDASRWLGTSASEISPEEATLLTVLQNKRRNHEAIRPSNIPGVDLIPATPEMQSVGALMSGRVGVENQLRFGLDELDGQTGVDIPSLAAVIASDHVLGVIDAGVKELHNLRALDQFVTRVAQRYGRTIEVSAVVPCAVPASGAAYREALKIAETVAGGRLTRPIRHSVSVIEAHGQRRPITALKRWQSVAGDYRAVAAQLTDMGMIPSG